MKKLAKLPVVNSKVTSISLYEDENHMIMMQFSMQDLAQAKLLANQINAFVRMNSVCDDCINLNIAVSFVDKNVRTQGNLLNVIELLKIRKLIDQKILDLLLDPDLEFLNHIQATQNMQTTETFNKTITTLSNTSPNEQQNFTVNTKS